MGLISKLANSTDLVNGMADRLGADLSEVIALDPEIQGPKYRNMVLRCSTCIDQAGCADLQRSCTHLDEAPEFCQNKGILEAVKPR